MRTSLPSARAMSVHKDLAIQAIRVKKMMRKAIALTAIGVALLVMSFITYAEFSNFFLSGSLLLVGTIILGIGSTRINKAQTLADNTRWGIVSLF